MGMSDKMKKILRKITKKYLKKYEGINLCDIENGKYKVKVKGAEGNIVDIPMDRNINISIIGKGNKIIINKELQYNSCININIVGDNNIVDINTIFANISLIMGMSDSLAVYNAKFIWGKSPCNGVNAYMLENNTSIIVGDDCMISYGIQISCTDDNTVLDENGNIMNKAKSIEIGNRVWLCREVLILKNSKIPDGCIVGARSVVAKSFNETNAVIVGNPARVVKRGVHWNVARPDLYDKQNNG